MAWSQLPSSYDVVARAYEARFEDELRDKPRDRELLDSFAASAIDPVLDVGCGPGQVGFVVRQRARKVIGIDRSREMARLARRRLDGAVVADMRALPIAGGCIGALVAFYSLIHVRRAELGPVLHELRRVLRPGGSVLFSAHEGRGEIELDEFLDEPVPFVATLFELDELVAATERAGLVVRLAERRPPYPSEHPTFRLYVLAERVGPGA